MKKYLFLIMLSAFFAQCHSSKVKTPVSTELDPSASFAARNTLLEQNRISIVVFNSMVAAYTTHPCTVAAGDCLVKRGFDPKFDNELIAKYPSADYTIEYKKARYSEEGAVRYRTRWGLPDQQVWENAKAEGGMSPAELAALKAKVNEGNVANATTQVIAVHKKSAAAGVYVDRFDAVHICPPPSPCIKTLDTPRLHEIYVDSL